MRFLQIMLVIVWLSFSWLCFNAVQWREPMQTPSHATKELEKNRSEARWRNVDVDEYLDGQVERWKINLSEQNLRPMERATTHAKLGTCFWLKAFLQTTYIRQVSYLKLSLREFQLALWYFQNLDARERWAYPRHLAWYEYSVADLLHQLGRYKESEPLYLKALKQEPTNELFLTRYKEMLAESGFPNQLPDEEIKSATAS